MLHRMHTAATEEAMLLCLCHADLALPGVIGVLFHGTWSLMIILDVAIIGLPDDCPQRQLATSSMLWLLASFVLTTCLQVWITVISLRGELRWLEDAVIVISKINQWSTVPCSKPAEQHITMCLFFLEKPCCTCQITRLQL